MRHVMFTECGVYCFFGNQSNLFNGINQGVQMWVIDPVYYGLQGLEMFKYLNK